ncbi:hypothetical protein V8B97DRAFT_1917589 [Scleroderma yunnanense]
MAFLLAATITSGSAGFITFAFLSFVAIVPLALSSTSTVVVHTNINAISHSQHSDLCSQGFPSRVIIGLLLCTGAFSGLTFQEYFTWVHICCPTFWATAHKTLARSLCSWMTLAQIPFHLPCPKAGCCQWFKNKSGLTQHLNACHSALIFELAQPTHNQECKQEEEWASQPDEQQPLAPDDYDSFPSTDPPHDTDTLCAEFVGGSNKYYQNFDLKLTGHPCDASGNILPAGQPPKPFPEKSTDDWSPYSSHSEFKLADFLFRCSQMSTVNINELLDLWNAMLLSMGQGVFRDSAEMYKTINRTPLGDMKWESDWAWNQADAIAQDPATHDSTFVPIILGSDKTTISVATGQNDYYPLYLSIGNIWNKVHHAHCNGVVLIGFLAMPHRYTADKEHASTPAFQHFQHQLFHASLAHILCNLKPTMTEPKVIWFGDGHYHCVIFSLGPYIANYEEQVLLACIVQGCNLDADALYQNHEHAEALIKLQESWDKYGIVGELVIIKGIFKDHLVEWVENCLKAMHGPAQANAILDNINQRIAAVAPFIGLHHFPEGHHFKQWTGNDLKVLMKVYLPAIEGHVPIKIVQTFRALLEFTYLACHNVITEDTLAAIQDTIRCFHEYWEIFCQLGMAPNGLCTSITESKHIDAVKDPYWQTNCNKPLGQMLIINQHLDKLAASRRDFQMQGMLEGTCLTVAMQLLATQDREADRNNVDGSLQHSQVPGSHHGNNEDNGEAVDCPMSIEAHVELAWTGSRTVVQLAEELGLPHLTTLMEEFLFQQLNPNDGCDLRDVPLYECPACNKITVINSAAALFYVPSDVSGIGGMRCSRACMV